MTNQDKKILEMWIKDAERQKLKPLAFICFDESGNGVIMSLLDPAEMKDIFKELSEQNPIKTEFIDNTRIN